MHRTRVLPFACFWLILFIGFVAGGCGSVYYGTYPDGLSKFPDRPITPAKAVEAAEPYLDQTWAYCRAERGSSWPDWEPRIEIKLEGKYYKIRKDDYGAKNADYGFNHAVIVNATTGEVIPPK